MSTLHIREQFKGVVRIAHAHHASLRNLPIAVAVIAWLMIVGNGASILLRYANTPAPSSDAPSTWPLNSTIRPQNNMAHLVAFLHPRCPCSRATLDELAVIMTRCAGKVTADLLVTATHSPDLDSVKTGLWHEATAIPGVRVFEDWDGLEARRFGATASGQILLYDSNKHLLFQGGITISRGHDGANDGVDAIISLLTTGTSPLNHAKVFGCSLRSSPRL